ncbi:MAG: DUF2975 domain-containing protein [Candidatus Contendobacter sp.]|nr:DUF2975 domain-containing protein [Candidatus Contendobacter sp.]
MLIQIVVIFAMVMLGIGIGALLSVEHAQIAAKIAQAGAPPYALWLIIGAMLLIMVLLAMAWRFFQELTGIVKSVGDGDPFHAGNAERLTRMGWISIGAHGLALILAGISSWFAPYLEKVGHDSHFGFEVEPTGILLTLILFILARVFKRGAEMREELEGTV